MVRPQEQEFDARLDELEQDARAGVRFIYAAEAIEHLRTRRPGIAAALDRDAGLWDTLLGALQTAAIAALVRIYEKREDLSSAYRALREGERTRAATQSDDPDRIEILAEAASGQDMSIASRLAALRAALDEHSALYDDFVAPIRHELFTESKRASLLEELALFQVVPRDVFEKLAVFPQRLHGALLLLREGRAPVLADAPSDIDSLLSHPADEWRDAEWEQRDIARDVWRFLTGKEDEDMSASKEERRPPYED